MNTMSSSVGIIGGADGPTAVFVTTSADPAGAVMAGLLVCLVGYLLGSIIFGIIISKNVYHDDVRTHGSGSAGMTNMLRTYGKWAAVYTAIGDIGKGVLAAVLGQWLFGLLVPGLAPVCGAYLGGVMAVIGHLFPVFFRFKGGKGVLTAAGAIIATQPVVVAALAVIWLVVFLAGRMVSLGSIVVAALYPVFTLLWGLLRHYNGQTLAVSTAAAAVMAALVIWMHRSNIQRLKNGTEYRFGSKKDKK